MEDYCGNINPGSNIGKSINLKASNIDYNVYLSWNSYASWNNNVKNYILEFYDNKTHTYSQVAILPNTDSTYTDTKFYSTDSAYCYRVKAIEDLQSPPDTSISNLAYIFLPPRINVPNAFSPNGDGINDIFYAQGIFIQNLTGEASHDYRLRIYDRWGTQLFETDDLNDGWDGTYQKKPCEIGVYIYELSALGFDNRRFNYKGTVQLLR
jgi:gliding motility-associated-like protein